MDSGARTATDPSGRGTDAYRRTVRLAPHNRTSPLARRAARPGRARTGAAIVAAFDVAVFATLVTASAVVGTNAVWSSAYVVACLAVGGIRHVYTPRIAPALLDAVPGAFWQAAAPAIVIGPLAAAAGAGELLWLPAATFAALVVSRTVTSAAIRSLRRAGRLRERVLIVGSGEHGNMIASVLREHPEFGLEVVGFVDEVDEKVTPKVLGSPGELKALLEWYAVDRVILAFGNVSDERIVDILRACHTADVGIHALPRLFELGVPAQAVCDDVWGIPLVTLRRPTATRAGRATKRVCDVAIASSALVLLAPLIALGAVLVRFNGPGPTFFRQKRVGRDEQIFEVVKFRTMPVNDDSDTTWTVDEDERLTRVGRFMRRTSLDEVPQLVNVLRGEMSIVGPRPERPRFVDEFKVTIPRYGDRHRVRGGITGWAQAHNLRGDTSIEERIRFDNYYIEHWSLWRDIVTLVKTVGAIVRGPK